MQRILLTIIIIVLIPTTVYRIFSGQSAQPVQRWDEKKNIAVVTNSLAHASFPILYFDDKPFFEKPPLWYMASAALTTATHSSPFSMRLVSLVSGTGIILLTVLLAWGQWGPIAAISAWVVLLCTNQLFITNAGGYFSSHTLRSADLDALQIFFMVITYAACVRITSDKHMSVVAGVSSGLALLTKGPMGIIPLFVATILSFRRGKAERHAFFTAWVILFFTAAPWYLFMTIRFGFAFVSLHIGYHIVDRAFFPMERHSSPPWYYLQLLTNHAVFFSWELLTGSCLWILVHKSYRDVKMLYTFVLTVLLFILPVCIQTRLAWYILPFYPFAALTIGAVTADIAERIRNP